MVNGLGPSLLLRFQDCPCQFRRRFAFVHGVGRRRVLPTVEQIGTGLFGLGLMVFLGILHRIRVMVLVRVLYGKLSKPRLIRAVGNSFCRVRRLGSGEHGFRYLFRRGVNLDPPGLRASPAALGFGFFGHGSYRELAA